MRIAWWKWLGVAGLAGVAATGVVAARDERQRRAYTPEEIRNRLHERVAAEVASGAASEDLTEVAEAEDPTTAPRPAGRLRRLRPSRRSRG